jgi:hypothetical protein
MSLDIPLSDFGHLPEELGCSLQRSGNKLVLAPSQAGCSMSFTVVDEQASLTSLEISTELAEWFTRDVVGVLFVTYGGNLDASLRYSPEKDAPPLIIEQGHTSHPLLDQAEPFEVDGGPMGRPGSLAMIEQWLSDAHAAWAEYQRLKQTTPSNVSS